MAINFPNASRSYDPRHHCVRFWGHDESREVTFQIVEDALARLDVVAARTEDGFLAVFDRNRERIVAAARKAYSRNGNGFYILAVSSF